MKGLFCEEEITSLNIDVLNIGPPTYIIVLIGLKVEEDINAIIPADFNNLLHANAIR
jgi:hypothetical protein